jgi:hypothetical protein
MLITHGPDGINLYTSYFGFLKTILLSSSSESSSELESRGLRVPRGFKIPLGVVSVTGLDKEFKPKKASKAIVAACATAAAAGNALAITRLKKN